MKQAVGYQRVSTQIQSKEGISLEAQEERIRAWCSLHGYELKGIYSDPGISGRKAKRPGLQKALSQLGKKDALIVYSLSRLSRSTKDTFGICDIIEKRGADLISLSEEINTTSATGKMVFRLLAVLAEFESDLISERIRTSVSLKRSRNEKLGGRVPFGFNCEGGKLVKNPQEQGVIKRVKGMRKRGLSLQKIANRLNDEGVPTKMGKTWYSMQVRHILKVA